MDNNMTPIEELIRYLDEELDADERLVLEQKLAADPGLSDQLEVFRVARQAVSTLGLRRKVNSIRQEMLREETRSIFANFQNPGPFYGLLAWARAAAVVIIMVFAAALYQYITLSSAAMFRDGYETFSLTQGRGAENEPG